MAFFRHRHVTGFPGFPDRRKERDVIVTSLSLPGHGPARVFAERLPWAKQWLTTGARTRRARHNCSALAMGKAMAHHWGAHKVRPAQLLRACHGQSNGFSNGWRAGKGMWQSLHFHKSSVKPMAWCARPRLHAKGKAIVGQKPCAKQFSRARFMRAPKESNCQAIVQALCKNARGHRIGP